MGAHDAVIRDLNGGAVARPTPPAVLDLGGLVVYGQIFDAWFDVVFDAVARRVPRHDRAVDLTHEAFASAWRQLPPGDGSRTVGGLLLRVARTVVRDREGGSRRRAEADRDAQARAADHLADADDAAAAMVGPGLVDLLWTAARTLPSKDVDLLDLHLRHGLDAADSAAAFDIDPAVAAREVGRLRQRFDEAVRSLVLWRGGDPLCIPLETRLRRARAARFDADTARLVQRHAEGCVWCRRRQSLAVDSFTLFAGIPRVAPGPDDRATVAAALMRAGVPLQGSVHGPPGGRRLSLGDTLRYGDGSLFTRARTRPDPPAPDEADPEVPDVVAVPVAAEVEAEADVPVTADVPVIADVPVAAGDAPAVDPAVDEASGEPGEADAPTAAHVEELPPPPPPPPLPPDNPSRVVAELSAAVASLSRRRSGTKRTQADPVADEPITGAAVFAVTGESRPGGTGAASLDATDVDPVTVEVAAVDAITGDVDKPSVASDREAERPSWAVPAAAAVAGERPPATRPRADDLPAASASGAPHRRPVTPPPPLPAAPPLERGDRDTRFVVGVAGAAAAAVLLVGVLAFRSRGDGAELRASGGAAEQGEVMDGSGLSRSGDGAAGVPDGGGGVRFGGSEATPVPGSPAGTGANPAGGPPNSYPGGVLGLAPSGGNGPVTGGGTGEVAGGPGSQSSPVTRPGDPPATSGPGVTTSPTTGATTPPARPVLNSFVITPSTATKKYAAGAKAPRATWSATIPADLANRDQYRVEVSGPGLQSTALSGTGVWVCPGVVTAPSNCTAKPGPYPYVLRLIGPGGAVIDSRDQTITIGA